MPSRLCLTGGCPRAATHRGRCRIHAKARVYSDKRWKLVRKRRLYLNPLCQECGVLPAEHVDHRLPVSLGGAPFALENTQALCAACHSAKSHEERR